MENTQEYKGYTIKIVQDSDTESPREWDNLGTMYCLHRRYNLGDKHNLSIEEVQEMSQSGDYYSLPLYLYDHSGITISTKPFGCRWDSGQVGIIAVSREKVRKEYNCKRISAELAGKVIGYLINEVKTYDDYLTGNVYGYQIEDSEGNQLDSCYGFYGESALEEAKSMVDYYEKTTPKQLELNFAV